MVITFLLSSFYMWWKKVPYFPLGKPEIRGWLVLRALFGFCGLFSLYCMSTMHRRLMPFRKTRRGHHLAAMLTFFQTPYTTSPSQKPQSSASSSHSPQHGLATSFWPSLLPAGSSSQPSSPWSASSSSPTQLRSSAPTMTTATAPQLGPPPPPATSTRSRPPSASSPSASPSSASSAPRAPTP